MKAYIVTMDDGDGERTIDKVFVDRRKARSFWVYDIWAYGTLNPEFHELKQAIGSFHIAERTGRGSMYGDPVLIVKEVTQ